MTMTSSLRAVGSACAICAVGWAAPAAAQTVSITGDTSGAPTFQRPVEDLSALSTIGTAAHYAVYALTAASSGLYGFTTTGAFDTFALLYDSPFVPTAALSHALIANDDLAAMPFNVSGFDFALIAGHSYAYVVTGFDNDEFGAFTTTITAPVVAGVPEPQTWALMALGLGSFCALRAARRSKNSEVLS